MKSLRRSSTNNLIWIMLVFVLVSALASLCLGASNLSLKEIIDAIAKGPGMSASARIIWYVRIPRTLACLLAGAALAVSGALIQGVLANQLASPSIIGVNAGAGVAVNICCALGVGSGIIMSGAAFFGAMLAALLVVGVAQKTGASRITVILGGVAVSSLLNAVSETITIFMPDAGASSAEFRLGGFSSVSIGRLIPAGILIVVCLIIVMTLANELEVISMGEETASSLGMRVSVMRTLFLGLAAALAGASVSFAGLLGFVGLIVPHMVRRLAGSESDRMLPLCALFGAGFVTVCDLLARMLFSPYELPAGIFMAFIGGPFFIYLLLHRKRRSR